MVDSIERAIYPVSLTAFVFGFGIFRHSLHNPNACVSVLYSLFVWGVYIYIFYYTLSIFTLRCVIAGFAKWYIMIISFFIAAVSLINTVCDHKKFHKCIKKLNLVDDTLEELGIPKEYRKLRTSAKLMLIIWCTVMCTELFLSFISYIDKFKDMRILFIPLLMNYVLYINTFIDIMFVLLLRYIGDRYDKINNYLEQLSETEERNLKYIRNKSFVITPRYKKIANPFRHILWITMQLHSELCHTARDLNNLFQIQMTLQMMFYSIVIVSAIYFQYYAILFQKQNYDNEMYITKLTLSATIWIIVYMIKLIILNCICENVNTKMLETKSVLHKLTNLFSFSEIREEIYQFLLQISLRPLQLNGMGLFQFGYRFLRKFFFWVLTAFVYLIQIKSSPISNILVSSSNRTCYN